MKQINVLWVCACIINHIFVKIIRMPVLDVSCYSLNLRCNNIVIYLDHSISVLKAIPWCKHIALIQDDFLPRTTTPLVSWCKHCCNNFFFGLTRVNPGHPIWPVTRSLDRVNDRIGFQNYACKNPASHGSTSICRHACSHGLSCWYLFCNVLSPRIRTHDLGHRASA